MYINIYMYKHVCIYIYIFVEMCGEVHNTQLGYDHACDPFSKWDAHARRNLNLDNVTNVQQI